LPLRRVGQPDYVAQTVVFLARNDYITGAVIPVDGGEHLIGTLK
jgi:NAD(P)-dependent dehydrogenase (short-subunit alcohol dehydrogenase family)